MLQIKIIPIRIAPDDSCNCYKINQVLLALDKVVKVDIIPGTPPLCSILYEVSQPSNEVSDSTTGISDNQLLHEALKKGPDYYIEELKKLSGLKSLLGMDGCCDDPDK